MDLRQLEYFVRVAEFGSFTKASEVLGIAQSALSRHVRKLEVEMRQNLLHRDGRGANLTDAGKRLLEHGHSILMQVDRAKAEMSHARGLPVGQVVVGLPHLLGRIVTVKLVREFQREFPHARISIAEGLTNHLQEWLITGRLDLAVLHNPIPSSVLNIAPLRYDDLFLLCPRDTRRLKKTMTLEELAEYPLILPRQPHPLRMLIETRLANLGRKPRIVLEIDAVAAIADLVEQGLGYTVMTMNAARLAGGAEKFRYRRIVAPDLHSILALASSSERPATTLAQRVHEMLCEFVPRQLAGNIP